MNENIKRVGDLLCDDIRCCNCPLQKLSCRSGKTLYEVLKNTTNGECNDAWGNGPSDPELYNLFKPRLDKEFKEGDIL